MINKHSLSWPQRCEVNDLEYKARKHADALRQISDRATQRWEADARLVLDIFRAANGYNR